MIVFLFFWYNQIYKKKKNFQFPDFFQFNLMPKHATSRTLTPADTATRAQLCVFIPNCYLELKETTHIRVFGPDTHSILKRMPKS